MAPLIEFLPYTWSLLDLIIKEGDPGEKCEDYKFVVDYVLTEWYSKRDLCEDVIKEWINCVTGGMDYITMERNALEALLLQNKNYRAFRVASSSSALSIGEDSRVRDLLQFFLSHQQKKFVWYTLVNSFFHNCEHMTRTTVIKGLFKTKPTTRIEQLFFISIISKLKKMTGRGGNSRSIALTSNSGQRIGWAIQTVLRGWDALAKYFGFKDVEQMLLPYIIFDEEMAEFVVIESRQKGYYPKKNRKMFDFPILPTVVADDTFKYAVDLDDRVDEELRKLASSCLEDCMSVAADTELYALSNSDKWARMDMFHLQGNSLPARFHQLPMENMSNIRKSIQTLGLQAGSATAFNLEPPTKTEDIPVSAIQINQPSTTSNIASASNDTRSGRGIVKRIISPSTSDEEFQPQKKMRTPASQQSSSELLDPLYEFMSPFAKMYGCSFEALQDLHKLMGLENLSNSVQLLLTDPPYNVRRDRGMEDSEYDVITFEQMIEVSRTASQILREGGHGIIFCSHEQISEWVEALSTPEITYSGHKEPTKVFAVDNVPLHIVRHPNYFSSNPRISSCSLLNTVEYAVHFKKNGLQYREEKQMVNYIPFNHVKSSFQGYRNVIDKVKGPLPGEQIRVSSGSSGRTKALRNEQKPLALLKELICRFSQPGDLVVDLFSGSFSTALACLQLEHRRRFVGCEQDNACFDTARDFITKRFAECIVEGNSNFNAPPPIKSIAEELVQRKLLKKGGDPKWCAPNGVPPFQRFPPHLVKFLSAMCRDIRLFKECAQRPFHLWPSKYQSLMQQIDIEQALCHEAVSQGLLLDSIGSNRNRVYCFTSRNFQPGEVICHCYGTIVYYNLNERTRTKKKYEEGTLEVDQETFKSFSIQLEVHGKKFEDVGRITGDVQVYLVPAPFCAARYIYNFDNCDETTSTGNVREPNVSLFQTTTNLSHPNKLLPYNLFEIRANTSIQSGAMLVLDNKTQKEKTVVPEVIDLD